MKVSDKDFDQLFSSKLADMEMEPSANVWSNIADELDGKKKNEKAGIPFMRIAASVVVLMAVGLFFIRPAHQKITLTASASEINKVSQRPSTLITITEPDVTTGPAIQTAHIARTATEARVRNRVYTTTDATPDSKVSAKQDQPKDVSDVNVHATSSENVIAAVDVDSKSPISGSSSQVPDIKFNAPAITKSLNQNNAPVIASTSTNPKTNTEPTKKRRIHGLGDLLNVVIAKVDKREDKIIEFTNSSDDDSFNVTGVNLGLIKAKKEK